MNSLDLTNITQRSRCAMGIDVVYFARFNAGFFQRIFHHFDDAGTFWVRSGNVIGIGRHAATNNLTVGAFTRERLEVLQLLSSQAAIAITNAKLYAEIKAKQRQLAQFLEAMPVGVFVLDAGSQPYYANQTAQEILGKEIVNITTANQLGKTYQLYQAGTDRLYPTEYHPIVRALRGEKNTVDDIEVHQGEKIIPLEVYATPVFDEKGEIIYAITAFTDISERKQAEAERIRFTQELAEYSRTLEQKVQERTLELSQTLEILKATQAELLFENELLRSTEESSIYEQGCKTLDNKALANGFSMTPDQTVVFV